MNTEIIFISNYRELSSVETDYPSMKDHFEEHPYPGQGKIIFFLMHGAPGIISGKSCYDVFTGELISPNKEMLHYKQYYWWAELAYYVKHYNLRLPSEIESTILSISPKEVYKNYKMDG